MTTKTRSRVIAPSRKALPGFLGLLLIAGVAAAEPLDAILARMDAESKKASSFSANVRMVEYSKTFGSEDPPSTGILKLKRQNNSVLGRMDIEKPSPYTWRFAGKTVERYAPKLNTVQVYDDPKMLKSADQYLLLVFGTSGQELRKSYDVKGGGEESVAGTMATRLELTPKDAKTREKYATKIELWIAAGQTYAVQVKVTQPNQDYTTWTYTDAKMNPALPDSAYEFTPPAGAERQVMK